MRHITQEKLLLCLVWDQGLTLGLHAWKAAFNLEPHPSPRETY